MVATSNRIRIAIASDLSVPHIPSLGRKLTHTAGRSGRPKIAQLKSARNWMHATPAGLPFGIPGIGDEMDGAMQQAPQWERQFIREVES